LVIGNWEDKEKSSPLPPAQFMPAISLKKGSRKVIGDRSSTVTLITAVVPGVIFELGPLEEDHL
jgi:hypothetical protein